MSIADRYLEFIANQILKGYLTDQVNPTISQLESDVRETQEWFTDMSKPMASFRDLNVDEREPSSADKFNDMQESFYSDLQILLAHTTAQVNTSVNFLNRNISEISMLKSTLKELEDLLDELLLANKDSEGYFQFFMDSFKSLRFVDTVESGVHVNLDGGYVIMQEDLAGRKKFNLNSLEPEAVFFTVLTRHTPQGDLYDVPQYIPEDILKAFKDGDEDWVTPVTFTRPMTVTAQMTVDIGEGKEVSKIEFVNYKDDATSAVTVHVQYSNDNYNWFDWPSSPFVQNIRREGIFTAPTTTMRWVRFILTRSGYDGRDARGNYEVGFGAKRIGFYGLDYDIEGSRLQSKAISPESRAGQIGYINRVSIESCEDLPAKTDILWYVSFDEVEWIPLSPVQRSEPRFANVVSLNKIQQRFDGPYNYVTPLEQVNVEDIAMDFNATALDPYSTSIWRDVGAKGNVDLVREVQRGWQFDDEFYSCYIWIDSFVGHRIDLGDTSAEVDGAILSGQITIPYGRHYFRTRKINWEDLGELTEIDQDVTVDGVINDTVRGPITDPLYPFNHKYLIEGLPYDADLLGQDERTRIYLGADRFAGERPVLISAFDLLYNAKSDDYTLAAKQATEILLKYNPGDPNAANEVFLIQSFFSSATDLPQEVLIRADLTSEEPGVSPVLYDYKVKFDAYYETT